jgi:SAM-dependent methyltransferase
MITSLFDHPLVFSWSQKMVPFTVWVYQDLMKAHIATSEDEHVLDIGCGVGAHAEFFKGQYTGIDINRRYIDMAAARWARDFRVMNGTDLKFPSATFDTAISVAIFHHLSDQEVRDTVREAIRVLRPGGRLHVIDPVLPWSDRAGFKRWLFMRDRGRHQRTVAELEGVLSLSHRVSQRDLRRGHLHDVAYFELIKEK